MFSFFDKILILSQIQIDIDVELSRFCEQRG